MQDKASGEKCISSFQRQCQPGELQMWCDCRGEAEEGEGREAIQALNIALTHSQKRDPGTFSVGAGLYKITPATASPLGKGVIVSSPHPLCTTRRILQTIQGMRSISGTFLSCGFAQTASAGCAR